MAPAAGIRMASVVCGVLLLAISACAQNAQTRQGAAPAPSGSEVRAPLVDLGLRFELEPQALALLKAMSARLAAAKTMSFTAVATYESPARTGQPLAYTTLSRVTVQRPDKLRVITPYDGAPSEFYYNGKTMAAFSPGANMIAVSQAPPILDAMLKAAYDSAAIYFPFTDLIVADPYKDMSEGLKLAFVVGQSKVVGHTTTDIVVVANDTVQVQLWIGAADHLPRMMRATYFDEPGNYRHNVELSDWQLNATIAPGAFVPPRAATARKIRFAAPDAALPTSGPSAEATR
ncbi:DUF2092 domain-containing protein [Paraburkholderia hospita]|uniref:DUF2092 domain-containing protein n=1 Tax=Paraburkholderia hospita TaxID=169430 RepID=UPI000B344959|nr:DUF2092 domain-containing protein [Paraburkholderia hospita]AXF05011.1 DUF2092 domain-containing protein [Paraburkholderia hospita]OUL73497.1 hypothetical protein CA603_43610 [Paraburkholderia hospita]